jgi:hypothetical protein
LPVVARVIIVLARSILGFAAWRRYLYNAETVRCSLIPILQSRTPINLVISYQYWTLNPNQAAVEPKMSPADPIISLKSRVGRRSNEETDVGGEGTLEKGRASTDAGTSVDATSRRPNDSAV